MEGSIFPFKATCLFDYKGQGMRTDVLLPKAGSVVTVLRCGETTADKGYNASWYFCESQGQEGWLPGRYVIPIPPKNTCPECKNLYGPDNRVRRCSECDREVCSLCGESFMLKVKRGQAKSSFICHPCSVPIVKNKGKAADAIEELNKLENSDQVVLANLRSLFEAAPVLERYILSLRPWVDYTDIINKSEAFVFSLLQDDRVNDVLAILNAHPKIGADPKTLSADSKKEQGTSADPQVLARLAELNIQYEEKYGFRFVVFVNGRSKEQIIPVIEERMNNSLRDEMLTAAKAMMDIARDRLKKRIFVDDVANQASTL